LLQAAGFLGAERLLQGAAPNRNPEFASVERPITEEWAATGYNNYYEFDALNKEAVKDKVGKFVTSPWSVEVSGLTNKPQKLDIEDLLKKMPIEERVYRFRCVEAWSMVVPWVGFPMAELIKLCDPKPNAKFVRFVTVNRPDQMPGMRSAPYPWPYFEGLRMDEAMNPLAMFVTGMYGKTLPKQNGAPIRVITPWKYGYKSIKSIVKIEFTVSMPPTLWNRMQPAEYGFYSNVNPTKAHPRWSQRFEKALPKMDRIPTQMFNGYEKWVASMYPKDPDA
jgi:sulfoxide reductase catalytic subunit YedY